MLKRLIGKDSGIFVAIVALCIVAGVLTQGTFFSERNLINVARQVSVNGILAIGMTAVILISGVDLSVGSAVALTGVVAGLTQQWGTTGSIVITLLSGLAIGVWNGFFITRFNIPSFIITLGMMTIARGIALVLTSGVTLSPMNDNFALIGQSYIPLRLSILIIILVCLWFIFQSARNLKTEKSDSKLQAVVKVATILMGLLAVGAVLLKSGTGIPIPVAIFAVCIWAGSVILNHTKWGRYIYAIGGNPEASHLSGINVAGVSLAVFAVMGLLSALSGIILTARLNAAAPTAGSYFELDAIASVVIGGTRLSGGEGSIGKTVIGAFIIGVLNNTLSLMNVETNYQYIIKGLIIIGAVMLDKKRR